ncbi:MULTISPECIES: Flp family type IVb pilin [unclassified Arthrobacter]|uniref:Flp family type IVb pilin n=1 Tax=unclassified Arthrobacter TaxID=235627 RepID=UPI001C84AB53|nr:Flp family type IVb pilin [Arthrobacter sp. MAHUQ-56]MBX7445210.1 Flp family type IVb pilin [Arthrobacter sp. MAHUQ-56]
MSAIVATICSFLHTAKARLTADEKGAAMVEYSIKVAFIAVLVLAAVVILGPRIAALFTSISNAL